MWKLTILICCLALESCKNKLNGKIEKRGANAVYLVNTSASKIFRFTLKTTTIINDSIEQYSTGTVELGPGDEILVGQSKAVAAVEYPRMTISVFRAYVNGSGSTNHPADTIINSRSIERHYFFNPDTSQDTDNVFVQANARILEKEMKKMKDTFLNGQSAKYSYDEDIRSDLLQPYPIKKFVYQYKVTGQLEINSKDYLKTKK